MRILVDADSCPVKDIIIKTAKKYNLPVIMFIDTSHIISDGYSKVITVDKQKNSADIELINHTQKGDIVVTHDFGVAAMALGKGATAVNHNGSAYSADNIDRLLFERHIAQKARRSGKRVPGPKGRNRRNDARFENKFHELVASEYEEG